MNFDKVMSSLAGSGMLGGLAGGAVSGALMSNKKTRKAAGNVLKLGGLAALGGMAWKAYQGYSTQQGNAAAVNQETVRTVSADPVWSGLSDQSFAIEANDPGKGTRELLLVQAMIAAACADGHLDSGEREHIMTRVSDAGLDPEEKAVVFDAMRQPLNLAQLSQQVDCPELAAEVYMASLLAVDHSRIEAELYLDALAYRLGLPDALVKQMNQQLPSPFLAVA